MCGTDLLTYRKGILDLARHFNTKKHEKRAQKAKLELQALNTGPLPCSEVVVQFINKYCSSSSSGGDQPSRDFARYMLGLEFPTDVLSICKQTPYCLYVYGGVTLEEAVIVSVVLIGFFDMDSATHHIRLLDVLPSPAEEAGGEPKKTGGVAVVEAMKRFGLPLMNLSAVHVDGNGASSEQICSQLRELNPNLVAFGDLNKMADAACHAAVTALSGSVQEIISDLHAYFTSTSMEINCLKDLFASGNNADSKSYHPSRDCLNFSLLVRKMLETWPDLVSFFDSCSKDKEKVKPICVMLQDANLKATFKFLALALKPLEAFQNNLEKHDGDTGADLLRILQKASSLLHTYAAHFLNPQAAERFLEEHDSRILTDKTLHQSEADLLAGGSAVEELDEPLTQVLSFYVTLTGHIAKQVPLSDRILKSMALLLNPESKLKLTDTAVEELGKRLGVCSTEGEVNQLTKELLEYQQQEEEQKEAEEPQDTSAISLEKHWAGVLKNRDSSSVLRKVVLSLLSFPCPPLEAEIVYAQVREGQIRIRLDLSVKESHLLCIDTCSMRLVLGHRKRRCHIVFGRQRFDHGGGFGQHYF